MWCILQIEKSFTLHGVNSVATLLVLSKTSVLVIDGELCSSCVYIEILLPCYSCVVNTGLVSQSAAMPSLIVGVGGAAEVLVFTQLHGVVSVSHTLPSGSQHAATPVSRSV